ncbi:MAG: right-handed parallel beta-helix repeat-containing protein [candidate division WOR-3 bacterium]|nr:right-handed parallel beta-helix repeat-containing protein [candidate division WOR-3 bacterium]
MKFQVRILWLVLATACAITAYGNLIKVPEDYWTIQDAITNAGNGDVISVWGPPPGQNSPPYVYEENVAFRQDINLTVVNRSFLPGGTQCPATWDSVYIVAESAGPTVSMAFGVLPPLLPHATLRGFTIRNPYGAQKGAGILAGNGKVTIEHCHIDSCVADSNGGGIYYAYTLPVYSPPDTVKVCSCLVENCRAMGTATSNGRGGGIFVAVAAYGSPVIQGNRVLGNHAGRFGGGLYVSQWDANNPPQDPPADTMMSDNWFEFDTAGVSGGGIYTDNCQGYAKRNVVVSNQPDGFYLYHPSPATPPLLLGTADSPGFNVLMDNVGDHDLVVDVGQHVRGSCLANGTYWGTLNTASIWSRIWRVHPEYDSFSIRPSVAASGKWFSVSEISTCSTDVIVTGDLMVDSGVKLSIEPHNTLEFVSAPDTSLPGGDSILTDLILAPGCSLLAIGTREMGDINFTSRPTPGSPSADRWYGIRLKPGSYAKLVYCDVDSAYCGVEVQSAFAEIETSSIRYCDFAGVYNLVDGHVNVLESDVKDNGVYGVRCWFLWPPQEPSRVESNYLSDNGHVGVSFDLTTPTDSAPHGTAHKVLYNHIVAGTPLGDSALYGVETRYAGDSVRVDSNYVSGFRQAGIALWTSMASVVGDTVLGDTVNGIACFLGSHPDVRWNTVKSNRLSGIACLAGSDPHLRWNTVDSNPIGVYCDGTSFPDLGTEEDSGYNSILFDNVVWVSRTEDMAIWLTAQHNWWGTDRPDTFPGKFLTRVIYDPWLDSAPGGGDGQQSAGSAPSLLETGLGRPLPMPMRGTARIPFQVAQAGPVSLTVVDASGRVVRALVRGERAPGRYNVTWDRSDNLGRLMPEGVYFLRFEAGARRDVQKLVVMR